MKWIIILCNIINSIVASSYTSARIITTSQLIGLDFITGNITLNSNSIQLYYGKTYPNSQITTIYNHNHNDDEKKPIISNGVFKDRVTFKNNCVIIEKLTKDDSGVYQLRTNDNAEYVINDTYYLTVYSKYEFIL
nr:ORF109B [Acipenserid herpesvirus 1]